MAGKDDVAERRCFRPGTVILLLYCHEYANVSLLGVNLQPVSPSPSKLKMLIKTMMMMMMNMKMLTTILMTDLTQHRSRRRWWVGRQRPVKAVPIWAWSWNSRTWTVTPASASLVCSLYNVPCISCILWLSCKFMHFFGKCFVFPVFLLSCSIYHDTILKCVILYYRTVHKCMSVCLSFFSSSQTFPSIFKMLTLPVHWG